MAMLTAAALPVSAQQKLVPAQSEVAFTSTQMGVPVQGRFNRFAARIDFDPRKPEAGRIDFTIDTASASIGVPELDAELAKPTWFDAARFPQASFKGSSAKAAGNGKYDVAGKLTIKGNTRDVVIPVVIAQAAKVATATGTLVIKRLDFGIGDGEWKDTSMVANDVQVRFKLVLDGLAAK
jgi:polyisoprenoid-binding protein YceI